jgi:hypothetical protein
MKTSQEFVVLGEFAERVASVSEQVQQVKKKKKISHETNNFF